MNTFKLKKNLSLNEYENTSAAPTATSSSSATVTDEVSGANAKKITSFNLPSKRSNDFNKFAQNSMFSAAASADNYTNTKQDALSSSSSNKKLATNSNVHPALVSTVNVPSYSNSINDETSSIAYTDDEKLMSSNQLSFIDVQMARSFPEFQQSMANFNLTYFL